MITRAKSSGMAKSTRTQTAQRNALAEKQGRSSGLKKNSIEMAYVDLSSRTNRRASHRRSTIDRRSTAPGPSISRDSSVMEEGSSKLNTPRRSPRHDRNHVRPQSSAHFKRGSKRPRDEDGDDEKQNEIENECKRLREDLTAMRAKVKQFEVDTAAKCEEVTTLKTTLVDERAQWVREKLARAEYLVKRLDEHFQCPLCLETMACPQILSPVSCGHTFCAMCILRWFFSQLHRPCGSWHDSLECPLCRAMMPYIPDDVPRTILSCPFAPNRLAEDVLQEMILELARLTDIPGDNHDEQGSVPGGGHDNKRGEVKGGTPADDIAAAIAASDSLSSWKRDGTAKVEWEARCRQGRNEVQYLVSHWENMDSDQLVMLKERYGV
ncbi:hypothetical protein K474DRAFT_1696910 [Panus rudis PR-1116 ss-1]|nr:hypothetical protein K474DRAFT_1696910 [Panus rudis PR-1116 ss-1]